MSNALTEFEQALVNHGLEPGEVAPDGGIHRIPGGGSRPNKNGYYVLHDNGGGCFGGCFGDWQTQLHEKWQSSKIKELSKKDRAALDARIEASRKQAREKREQERKEAAAKALEIWEAATEATDGHPYLEAKGVPSFGLRVSTRGQLLVPVLDTAGNLHSVQFIDGVPDEKGGYPKKFLAGGQIGGNCFTIPGKREAFYVCEGYATGASIHLATGQTVVCAFNAGNLKQVARAVRTLHPKAELVVAADNDQWTDGNPGKTKGMEAAKEAKALFTLPHFRDESRHPTDFNDMARLEGMEAVRLQLQAAKIPENKPNAQHFPFTTRPDGVYFLEEDKDGGFTPVWICSPLEVIAQTHNEHKEQWGRFLKVTDRSGYSHSWAMPMSMTAGSPEEFMRELLSLGLDRAMGRKAAERIGLFISRHPVSETFLCADRIGWHGDSFVLPDRTFSPSGSSGRVVFQGEARAHNFRTKGTLAEWQEQIGRYAVGNSRLAMALSIALAGPLLHVFGGESGGFHFFGTTSEGKSTIMFAAGSVCGGGKDGYHKQWRVTDNALEAIASAHCDSLLCLDEIGQCDGRVVSETSYMLANGQGKQRLSKGATIKKAYTWRLVFLSNGEKSCAEKIREAGLSMKAGQEIRVLDIPAVPANSTGVFEVLHGFESGEAFSEHIKLRSGQLHGCPLPAFLSELVANAGDLRPVFGPFYSDFQAQACPSNAPHAIKRACKRFALVAMAGTLATAWNIFPWPGAQATEAATICFQDWLKARGGVASMDAIHGVERVRSFIMAHGSSRFEIVGGGDAQKVVNRAGFKRRNEADEWVYMISPDVFRQEVCAGLNVQTVCQELRAQGALLSPDGRFLTQIRESGGQRGWCYAINEKALFESDDRIPQ